MKKFKILILVLVLTAFEIGGCTDEYNTTPTISAKIFEIGKEGNADQVMVPVGTGIVYKFSIESNVGLKKVELWQKTGIGVNAIEPKNVKTWNVADFVNKNKIEISDTIESLSSDVQYSVYVQDLNDNYETTKVNGFLDVMLYSQKLTDGSEAGTSPTFLNIESGLNYYIANTIGDPTGMDLGFSYMENTTYEACLVAFDEYYKTGNYGMVVNNLNPTITFRDATRLMTKTNFGDEVKVASDLKTFYDKAQLYPNILSFTSGKIAFALKNNDVIAFLTEDGRYGLLKVNNIERKDESVSNNQTISFNVIVDKKQ
jgi:hypothetical protein